MPWLLRDGDVLASIEVPDTMRARMRGLLGRDGFDGALLLKPAIQVHTLGMRFAVDVAFLDRDLRVVTCVLGMQPWRVGLPRLRARAIIEAEAGAFGRWNLRAGDELELR